MATSRAYARLRQISRLAVMAREFGRQEALTLGLVMGCLAAAVAYRRAALPADFSARAEFTRIGASLSESTYRLRVVANGVGRRALRVLPSCECVDWRQEYSHIEGSVATLEGIVTVRPERDGRAVRAGVWLKLDDVTSELLVPLK